jgi:hypothetical protein
VRGAHSQVAPASAQATRVKEPAAYEELWRAAMVTVDEGEFEKNATTRAALFAKATGYAQRAVALNPGIIDTEMLRACFGGGAASYPDPEQWVKAAGPFILHLTAQDNGHPQTVPGMG